ncbi:hypothetical protein EVAR_83798_1 [Eumeta japonica]|uniref:Uncharacterized protein n=1 Tax=Eumeta variegata TaxID=151549 RepID=A0A4C1WHL4_EUMVA|nr:hypothetical protein EVAR_83798_1 [Eumeta japonica]
MEKSMLRLHRVEKMMGGPNEPHPGEGQKEKEVSADPTRDKSDDVKARRWQLAGRGKQQRNVCGNGGGLHPKRTP